MVSVVGFWQNAKGAVAPVSGSQTYDATGTHNWTVPDGVYLVLVELWGGGGGGGNSNAGGWGCTSGAGAAYVCDLVPVVPGSSIQVIVGAGGASVQDGGYSQFKNSSYRAAGGGRGYSSGPDYSVDTPATPGAYSAGHLISTSGGPSGSSSYGGGGAGGSGGTGGTPNYSTGGVGGAAAPNGSLNAGGAGATLTGSTQVPGNAPGGGGGRGNSSVYAGGPGGDGKVIIKW